MLVCIMNLESFVTTALGGPEQQQTRCEVVSGHYFERTITTMKLFKY
jgi:hypothetical protein